MTDLVWSALTHIAKKFRPRSSGEVRGSFAITDDVDQKAVELCQNHQDDTGLQIHSGQVEIGSIVQLSFQPRVGYASVATSMDDLLEQPGNRIRAKQRFIVLNPQLTSEDQADEKSIVGRYFLAISFVKTLKEVAGFLDADEQSLVFFSGGRFDVPVLYGAADLNKMDCEEVKALTSIIPGDTHRKQCLAILSSSILESPP